MPLISARNPDVLDVANIGEHESHSMLRRHSPVTIQHASAEDAVSVMTIHSAFQTTGREQSGNSSSKCSKKPNLSIFSRKEPHPNEYQSINLAQDEFSVNSLPIQDSDIESVEQIWLEEQRKVDDILERSKKFSTQTYSDKGTVHSSLHRNKSDRDERSRSTTSKSAALNIVSVGDRSYVQNSSKTRGTARLLPMEATSRSKISGQATSETVHTMEKKNNSNRGLHTSRIPSRPKKKSSRRRTNNLMIDETKSTKSTKSTNDETNSVVSHLSCASHTSSNKTSESTLHKEMFRLSLELANTLSSLDISNSEIARYRKHVEQLQKTVEELETEKAVFKAKLEGYERAKILETGVTQKRHEDGPVCVTPSRPSEPFSSSNERREFFSPETYNSSFSDPVHGSRDTSGLLFPELNESHISCPDLYTSRIHDDLGATIEEEDEDVLPSGDEVGISVDLIDPREEVFNDDPFATFNYSNDESESTSGSSSGGEYAEEDTIFSKASTAAEVAQSGLNTTSASVFSNFTKNLPQSGLNTTSASVFSNFAKNLPMFRKKAKDSLNNSIESRAIFMKNLANVAPSKQDSSFLNRSSKTTLNISRIFKFGDGNEDALSVSVRSHSSHASRRPNFPKFGK